MYTHTYVCIYIYFGIKQIKYSQIQIGCSMASPFLMEEVLNLVILHVCYLLLASETVSLEKIYLLGQQLRKVIKVQRNVLYCL